MVALDSLLRTVEPVKERVARGIVRRCWWRPVEALEPVVAEPIPCVAGVPPFWRRGGVEFFLCRVA